MALAALQAACHCGLLIKLVQLCSQAGQAALKSSSCRPSISSHFAGLSRLYSAILLVSVGLVSKGLVSIGLVLSGASLVCVGSGQLQAGKLGLRLRFAHEVVRRISKKTKRIFFIFLVQNTRHRKRKWRNNRLKLRTINSHNLIRAVHAACGSIKQRTAGIFKLLIGLQQRLRANNTESFYLIYMAIIIGNNPMAANELRSDSTHISNDNRVRKGIALVVHTGLIRQISGLHTDRKRVLLLTFHFS